MVSTLVSPENTHSTRVGGAEGQDLWQWVAHTWGTSVPLPAASPLPGPDGPLHTGGAGKVLRAPACQASGVALSPWPKQITRPPAESMGEGDTHGGYTGTVPPTNGSHPSHVQNPLTPPGALTPHRITPQARSAGPPDWIGSWGVHASTGAVPQWLLLGQGL